MRIKRIFSMFLTLILVVSIVFPGIKLTSYAQSGSDLMMENDWGIQATKIKEYVKQLSEIEKQEEIKIAVIDTGVDISHEVFVDDNKLKVEKDPNYKEIDDRDGTGTVVAGIIANALKGMNYKIIPYAVIDSKGSGSPIKIREAITSAAKFGCDVIHLSHNSGSSSNNNGQCSNIDLHRAIDDALKSGTNPCIVAGAGDTASDDIYKNCPAHVEEIIVVGGATRNSNNSYSSSSNFNRGTYVDFYAPGENIISAKSGSVNSYIENSSTYAAAAFVTAMAAIYKAKNKAQNKDLTCGEIAKEIDNISASMEVDTNTGEERKFPTFKIKEDTPPDPPPGPPIPPEPKLSPVYRLRNKTTGAHYYTIYYNEMIKLTKTGWEDEGMKWYGLKEKIEGAVAVYKLYNEKLGRHLFTTEGEAQKLVKSCGWELQNHNEPVFYSYGDIKIYRLYNPNNSDHLLTISEKERDDRIKDGWIWESDTLRAFKEGEK